MAQKYVIYIKIRKKISERRTGMSLRIILEKIIEDGNSVLLCDSNKDWEASELLANLSEPMLRRQAYLQAGLYIAEINDSGFLGQVLYKIKRKA